MEDVGRQNEDGGRRDSDDIGRVSSADVALRVVDCEDNYGSREEGRRERGKMERGKERR